MRFFVDTSVWSLAFRRDTPLSHPAVDFLDQRLAQEELVFTTGLVLQELLQGFQGPRDRQTILDRFDELPFIDPERKDYVAAAEIRNLCRRHGVQIGTVDALIGRLCIAHDLTLLTADNDFTYLASHAPLKLWLPSTH